MEKKLTRSRTRNVVAGVLGGMGTYFAIDPNILRILFVLFVIATGFFPGVFAYIIAAIFIPKETAAEPAKPVNDTAAEKASAASSVADDDTAI